MWFMYVLGVPQQDELICLMLDVANREGCADDYRAHSLSASHSSPVMYRSGTTQGHICVLGLNFSAPCPQCIT